MWFIRQIISNYWVSDISDDDSDSESDCSLEPMPGSKRATSSSSTQVNPDVDNMKPEFLNINDETEDAGAEGIIQAASELDLTTDAAKKTYHFPKPEEALNVDKVLLIEKQLDVYEIVSLVYLLYEDAFYALQELLMLLKGAQKNPLYDWAIIEEKRESNWQEKMIEALSIIKNYQILKNLGYQKQDLIVRYLPHRPKIVVASISSVKKTLYLVCEKLDGEKTNKFLQQVKLNFQEDNLPFVEYDPEFLELYFLKWETIKYISMTNLNNIKKALKVINEEILYDYLDGAVPQDTTKKGDNPPQSNVQLSEIVKKPFKTRNPSTSIDTQLRSSPTSRVEENYELPLPNIGRDNADIPRKTLDADYVYKIDPKNPGLLLIINQQFFYKEIDEKFKNLLPTDVTYKFEARLGTDKDCNDLCNVFEKFGFKVVVEGDLSHEEMMAKIKATVENIKDESSLFVCIMSHGDKGVVYGANSCKVKVSKIQEVMCKTNKKYLSGKPKILILQSCQGKMCQKINDGSSEEEVDEEYAMTTDGAGYSKQPRTVDMLTFWATVPGFAAIRNKKTGSWFIQALCKKMQENANRLHFSDICTRIVSDVSSKIWTVEEENENAKSSTVVPKKHENAMTPMVVSTLTKDFYLPPMKNV